MTMHPFCGLDSGRGRAIILQTDRQTDRQAGRQTALSLSVFAAQNFITHQQGALRPWIFHGCGAPCWCALERRRRDGKGQSL